MLCEYFYIYVLFLLEKDFLYIKKFDYIFFYCLGYVCNGLYY